jgi:hypothetical protein
VKILIKRIISSRREGDCRHTYLAARRGNRKSQIVATQKISILS